MPVRSGGEEGLVLTDLDQDQASTLAGLDCRLAQLMLMTGDLDHAAVWFEQVIGLNAGPLASAPAWHGLGIIHAVRGDRERAEASWLHAILTCHPDYAPRSALLLGNLFVESERWEEARHTLQTALDSAHEDAAPRALLGLGIAAEMEGDYDSAYSYWQRALEGRHAVAAQAGALLLGGFHCHHRRYALGEPALRLAMEGESKPIREAARAVLGIVYYELREYDKAIACLESAARTLADPAEVARAVSYLTSALIEAGRPQDAQEVFRRYSTHPDPAVAGRVRSHRGGFLNRMRYADLPVDHWRVGYSRGPVRNSDDPTSSRFRGVVRVRRTATMWTVFHRCEHRHMKVADARQCAAEWLEGWLADLAKEQDGARQAGAILAWTTPWASSARLSADSH